MVRDRREVKRSGAAPSTSQWDEWLSAAEENAKSGNRKWDAVEQRERIIVQAELVLLAAMAHRWDTAAQHVPAIRIPQPRK